ncbi:MAG: hypothetical protein F4Z04_02505 [Acidobacteria bacterium]|nr:hypothetical protein [Acidobacteriota bacterium]
MNADRLAATGAGAWRIWLRTVLAAVAATLAVRAAAIVTLDIPAEFQPLAVAGPTVFLTSVGVVAGLTVALAIDRWSARPVQLFRRIAIAALLLSLLPDFWLLTDAGSEAFPGATVPAVVTLMVQHVAAAAVVILVAGRPRS